MKAGLPAKQFGYVFFKHYSPQPTKMPHKPSHTRPTLPARTIFLIATTLVAVMTRATAQDETSRQIQIGAGLGSCLPLAPKGASAAPLASFRAEAAILFSKKGRFLFGTGVGVGEWRNETTNSAVVVTPDAIDKDGEAYEHRMTLDNITERQKICTVDIPLHLVFRASPHKKLSFEARTWAGVSIPLVGKFKTTGGSIRTEGYYEKYNLLLYDMPTNGFYTDRSSHRGELGLKALSAFAGVGAGASVRMGGGHALGVEAFISHTFSDLRGTADAKQFDPDCLRKDGYSDTKYHSVLETAKCEAIKPTIVGVSIFFRTQIGHRRRRETRHPETMVAARPNDNRQPAPTPPTPPTPETKTAEPAQDATPAPDTPPLQELIDREGPIGFDLGGTELSRQATGTVERIAQLIANGMASSVIVIGHTCDKGSDATNQRVGLLRAKAVADKLMENGVPRGKLSISSAGATKPRFPNDSEANRAQNRRVEIIVK